MMGHCRLFLCVVVCLMSSVGSSEASYEEEVLADSPFVYYRFNETGGETAKDSSGNGHDGQYSEVELGQASAGDSLGTAARFDGFASLVDVPVLELESDTVTIETWLNVDYIVGGCCTSVFSPNGWEPGWLHYNLGEPGRVEFALNSGGPNDHWTFADALPLEEWAHVVSTYDADEALARIWIDGEEIEFDIPTFDTPQTVTLIADAQIGAWQNSRFLAGAIDEFAIYDSVLSEERIIAHYNARNDASAQGDFNGDGVLDIEDINDLTDQSASGINPAAYDLNADTLVDAVDVNIWIRDLFQSWLGDANLDGEFNSGDLVVVLSAGTYEQDVSAVWSTGDFNGDGRSDTADLVVALSDGGYESGPRAAVSSSARAGHYGHVGVWFDRMRIPSTLIEELSTVCLTA